MTWLDDLTPAERSEAVDMLWRAGWTRKELARMLDVSVTRVAQFTIAHNRRVRQMQGGPADARCVGVTYGLGGPSVRYGERES